MSLLFLVISSLSFAQTNAKLKIWLDPISEQLLIEQGFEMDHGVVKPGVFIISDFSASEVEWIKASGIRYEILIEDVTSFYQSRTATDEVSRGDRATCGENEGSVFQTPSHFKLGSMGGFYTYEEFLAELDSMHFLYPDLITERAQIDTFTSIEDRPIYWVKLSDNVATNESEPELLYTAIHHAREPQSLTQLIYYMWYLLENYGTDAEVTHLINNTQMFFIPMINPDGYRYNQITDPNGGGMWRKNRRNNGNGTSGVDLNRNYGYDWGIDDEGSSPSANSQTYRGTAAFSEPETRAVEWFCEQHEFGLALNYHAHGNYLIYPWGSGPTLTPDSNVFIAMAQQLTRENNYVFGTGMETVGYSVNGDSDDWMYGEQGSKNKIFAMTPEVGNQSDGFWPAQSRIEPLSNENVLPNLLLAHFAGDYMAMQDQSSSLLTSISGSIDVSATRLGLQFNGPYTMTLLGSTSNVLSVGSGVSYATMDLAIEETESITYSLDPSIQVGDAVAFDLVATFNGYSDTLHIEKIYGTPTLVYNNTCDSIGNNFSVSGLWGLTDEDYVTASSSITDSPYDTYFDAATTELAFERIIDLRESILAQLTFQSKWSIEAGWDYAQILASPVGSETWAPLCGKFTKEGTENQDFGQPVWDGFQTSWVEEEIDLSDYLGQRIKIKFILKSDLFVHYDGFYIDDLTFATVQDSAATLPLDTGYLDTVGVDPNGIQAVEQQWRVYPNPTQDVLFVQGEGLMGATYTVFDLAGKQVSVGRIQSRELDFSDLEAGFYVLKIVNGNHKETHTVSIIR